MRSTLAILAALGGLASCHTAEPLVRQSAIDTREAMIAGVNPAATAISDIANAATGEGGELDARRLGDDEWARLRENAEMLAFWSEAMANAGVIRASGPNLVGGEVPEGAASRAEIQAMIDRDPEGFRAEARDLADRARLIVEAVRARDAAAVGHRAAEIDAPCQSCHTRYWYKQDTPVPREARPNA
jgi:cytochrome c556